MNDDVKSIIARVKKTRDQMAKAPPCRPFGELTMIESTLWDNWGSDERPEKLRSNGSNSSPVHRYGFQFNAWAGDPTEIKTLRALKDNLSFSVSTRLYPIDSMAIVSKSLLEAGKITKEYFEEIDAVITECQGQSVQIGLFSGSGSIMKGAGRGYIPNQFVVIEIKTEKDHAACPEYVRVHIDGETSMIDGWVDYLPGPSMKPLVSHGNNNRERALFASRIDRSGLYKWKNWDSRKAIVV